MALKRAENMEPCLEDEDLADHVWDTGAGAGASIITTANATPLHLSPTQILSPPSQAQSKLIRGHTLAKEEEEGSSEGDTLSHSHMHSQLTDNNVCINERLGDQVERSHGKGKERHLNAKQEESSGKSTELVSISQCRQANSEDGTQEWENFDAPEPSVSQAPSGFSGRSTPSFFPDIEDSEGGGCIGFEDPGKMSWPLEWLGGTLKSSGGTYGQVPRPVAWHFSEGSHHRNAWALELVFGSRSSIYLERSLSYGCNNPRTWGQTCTKTLGMGTYICSLCKAPWASLFPCLMGCPWWWGHFTDSSIPAFVSHQGPLYHSKWFGWNCRWHRNSGKICTLWTFPDFHFWAHCSLLAETT